MATRILTIEFEECETPPVGGYNVQYREVGSLDPHINAGNFAGSPAIIYIEDAPDCAHYEGFVQSVCYFGMLGNPQPFETEPCEEPAAPVTVVAMANFDGTITVVLPLVGTYQVKIIEEVGGSTCADPAVEEFVITNDDEGTSPVLPPGTYFACVRAICDGGCVFSAYVRSEDDVVVGEPCEIWANLEEENAEDVSWTDCNGNIHANETLTPGSNLCAEAGTLTGPGSGLLTQQGPCPPLEEFEFHLANTAPNVCAAPDMVSLWYAPPFQVGTILYTTSAATTQHTGHSFVREPGGNAVYNLGTFTGQVGAITGTSC